MAPALLCFSIETGLRASPVRSRRFSDREEIHMATNARPTGKGGSKPATPAASGKKGGSAPAPPKGSTPKPKR